VYARVNYQRGSKWAAGEGFGSTEYANDCIPCIPIIDSRESVERRTRNFLRERCRRSFRPAVKNPGRNRSV